jgi:hypothetical protein
LVLVGSSPGLDDLAPGRLGRAVRPVDGLGVPLTRDQLEFQPIVRPVDRASVIDRAAGGETRVAARRLGAGRVIQLGERESWRLAFGSDPGNAEHARWWSRAAALASPRESVERGQDDDVAPRAALVAAIGPATSGPPGPPSGTIPWEAIAAVALLIALLADWVVRRVRGQS